MVLRAKIAIFLTKIEVKNPKKGNFSEYYYILAPFLGIFYGRKMVILPIILKLPK